MFLGAKLSFWQRVSPDLGKQQFLSLTDKSEGSVGMDFFFLCSFSKYITPTLEKQTSDQQENRGTF